MFLWGLTTRTLHVVFDGTAGQKDENYIFIGPEAHIGILIVTFIRTLKGTHWGNNDACYSKNYKHQHAKYKAHLGVIKARALKCLGLFFLQSDVPLTKKSLCFKTRKEYGERLLTLVCVCCNKVIRGKVTLLLARSRLRANVFVDL